MGANTIRYHASSRCREGAVARGSAGCRRTCRVRIGGVSIWSGDAIRSCLRLGLRLSLRTAKARALEQMLLLARGVLRADLLTVDALDGETLMG